MGKNITSENILAKLRMHNKSETPRVCLIAELEIVQLRMALTEARRELSNYTRGDMGGENRSVTDVIATIDAALTP